MARFQKTIKEPIEIKGKGLFSGQDVIVKLNPAAPNTGIVFTRTDLPEKPKVLLNPTTIKTGLRSIIVANEKIEVHSIEHLLSACYGLGIDNLEVELNALEPPSLDGSSRPFVDLFKKKGIVEQSDYKKEITINEPFYVNSSTSSLCALPDEHGLSISFTLEYKNKIIGRQHMSFMLDERSYEDEISSARTFCLKSEAEDLIEQGLGKGGDYSNTLIVDEDKVINNTLRFKDEFVRHKILDLLGDLAALGGQLKAHIVGVRSGHNENVRLIKKIAMLTQEQADFKRAEPLLDAREILKIIPHRYPMLLIDKVIELDGYTKAVGIKNVTINEPFFQGHFPSQPIMPGVLIIEAMAQLAGALLMRKSDNVKKTPVLLSLDNVKLRKSVFPGDQLRIEAETVKIKQRTGEVYCRALVEGQVAAEALMKFMLIEQETI